jgi:ADP-ribose pyrophosphatase YjhB (NUDIX family)
MKRRVRVAAIVVEDESTLLVQHQHDDLDGGERCWVPPSGGVEGEDSFIERAKRETLEEIGPTVELGRIAHIREFLEPGYHHFEVLFVATSNSGTVLPASPREPGTWEFEGPRIARNREASLGPRLARYVS